MNLENSKVKTMNNNELFDRSKKLVPGGVHSPVRSFKGLSMAPRFVESAKGATFRDVEGKEYIDFCMSFGPLILGHTNETVESKLVEALSRGWSFGACEHYSLDLAELLISKIPFIDQIRFVNSGTEAVMTALRLARGYTKKNKIIKFNGCYHGHVDSMLIKAGSGLAGEADASSLGVPEGVAEDTLILELGDTEGVKEIFKRHKNEIAAIIIEPLPANNGLLVQDEAFLSFLRDITTENNSLLIFDEVISGLRIGFTGMSGKLGITPDIVTYGKIIGGGLPVGALGARTEIMECLAPIGGVYQAGTLSANPLAMVGGYYTLKQLTDSFYESLNSNTQKIVSLFEAFFAKNSKYNNYKVKSYGSLFWITPDSSITRACDIPATLGDTFAPFFEEMLERGIYLAPNAYEVSFISAAHDEKVIQKLKSALEV